MLVEAVKRARSSSLFQAVRELRREMLFPRLVNAVRGTYASFTEAMAGAPGDAVVGYDTAEHAAMYDERIDKLLISDYAVLFWFERIQNELRRVFDLGGHKGVLYYGFRKRLKLPSSLRWVVCDMPTTVTSGKELAIRRGMSALDFTTQWEEGSGSDLLIASGVLQYLDWDLAGALPRWRRMPRYVIVNNTPMYDGDEYITLQNTGISYNPYRVFNRADLIRSLRQLGYRARDTWRTERSLDVPLHPELHVDAYQGFIMERVSA